MSVAIIGWWAAGIMCAATLLENWYSDPLFLFDKNPSLWAKVIISGWGRCNVTTGYYKKHDLQDKYPHGWDFLQEAIIRFGPRKIRNRFTTHSTPLKQEDDRRVFPVSDNGRDIVWVFEKLFSTFPHLHLHCSTRVMSVKPQWWWFEIQTSSWNYLVDSLVLATGGNAYRHTGSTGDGYTFAQWFGHTITPLWPSLTSFEVEESIFYQLSWISLPCAHIVINDTISCKWSMLFTHFWISGPMIFAFSAYIAHQLISKSSPYHIKLIPDYQLSYEQRLNICRTAAQEEPHKHIHTLLRQYLPRRMIDLLLEYLILPWEYALKYCSKEVFIQVAQLLWNGIPLTLIGRRNGDEFVTSWWVSLDEIDHLTMRSKLHSWLYIVGELLDVDGLTWGYNLTASRATGRLAGEAIILQ